MLQLEKYDLHLPNIEATFTQFKSLFLRHQLRLERKMNIKMILKKNLFLWWTLILEERKRRSLESILMKILG